jgi:hypothetical protein
MPNAEIERFLICTELFVQWLGGTGSALSKLLPLGNDVPFSRDNCVLNSEAWQLLWQRSGSVQGIGLGVRARVEY